MTNPPKNIGENLHQMVELLESTDCDVLLSLSDDVLQLLVDEERRHLIYYLSEQDTPTPLSRIAMELAGRINDTAVMDVTPDTQEQIQLNLIHNYLPRLADYGLLSWSNSDEMIDPLPTVDNSSHE